MPDPFDYRALREKVVDAKFNRVAHAGRKLTPKKMSHAETAIGLAAISLAL